MNLSSKDAVLNNWTLGIINNKAIETITTPVTPYCLKISTKYKVDENSAEIDEDEDGVPEKRGRGRRKKNHGKSTGGSMEAYIRNRPLQIDLSKPLIKKGIVEPPKPFINNNDKRTRYSDKELAEFKKLILEKKMCLLKNGLLNRYSLIIFLRSSLRISLTSLMRSKYSGLPSLAPVKKKCSSILTKFMIAIERS